MDKGNQAVNTASAVPPKTEVSPQKPQASPQKPQASPQKSQASPQKTQAPPQKAQAPPQKTQVSPQKGTAAQIKEEKMDADTNQDKAATAANVAVDGAGDKAIDEDIANGQSEDEDDEDKTNLEGMEDDEKAAHERSLIVKIKGLPKLATNKMHLMLYDLFAVKLEVGLPLVRHPKGKDKWVYAECQTMDDKKKILSFLEGTYKYNDEHVLQAVPGWISSDQKAADPLDMESALDILFKHRKLPYKEQLAAKTEEAEKMLKEIFDGLKKFNTKFGKAIEKFPVVSKMVPMIPVYGYAFDCSFTIEADPETKEVVVGLRASNRTAERVIPLDLCPNIPKNIVDAVKDFVQHLKIYGLKPVNRNTETGNIVGLQCKMNTSCEIIMSILVPKENTFLKEFIPVKTPEEVQKAIEEKKEAEAKAAVIKEEEEKGEATVKVEGQGDTTKPEGTPDVKVETITTAEQKETSEIAEGGGDANKEESKTGIDDKADDSVALIEMDDEENKATDEEKAKYGRQLKEVKPGLIKYFNERGKTFGIVSIFSNWIIYNRRGDWAGRQHFYHHICGATTVKEQIINLQYDLWPYKQWSPRTSTFGTILNTIDSLVQLDKSTSIAVASEYRLVALYYAKRCKEVVCIHSWSGKKSSIQMHGRWVHKQAIRNIEFISTKTLQALDRTNFARATGTKVAIVWGFSKAVLLRKFFTLGVKKIITICNVNRNIQTDLQKYLEAVAPTMAATKVIPVDTQPHGGQYSLVCLIEEIPGGLSLGGAKRKINEPLSLGIKRKRPLPPLLHDSSMKRGAWESGHMLPPPIQNQIDPLNSTISQLTGFMQSQMLFNEMMKAGIQEILPQRDPPPPPRQPTPPPPSSSRYGGGRSSWGGRDSRGGRFNEEYAGRSNSSFNGRDSSPGRWGAKRDEAGGGFRRNRTSPKSLTEAVWGPQNTTMSLSERRSYLGRPPNYWPASIDNPASFNSRDVSRDNSYNYDRRDKRARDGPNNSWERY